MEKRLVPASTAQFPGSFAPDLRRDDRKYCEDRTFSRVVYTYLTDSWDDISLWKSAVSSKPRCIGARQFSNLAHTTMDAYWNY